MPTEKEILEAEGEVLSRLLGEVLQPEKNEHDVGYKKGRTYCRKCTFILVEGTSRTGTDTHQVTLAGTRPCKFPDPIPLDWPNAMRWRDWAVEKYGKNVFLYAMYKVEPQNLKIIALAQPSHYLKATALCKLESEK